MPPLNDKALKQLKEMQKRDDNKICIGCGQKGLMQDIVMQYRIFVCQDCAGVFRGLGLRTKGINMSSFSQEEVDSLKDGNQGAHQIYLARLRGSRTQFDSKTFIDRAFIKRDWCDRADTSSTDDDRHHNNQDHRDHHHDHHHDSQHHDSFRDSRSSSQSSPHIKSNNSFSSSQTGFDDNFSSSFPSDFATGFGSSFSTAAPTTTATTTQAPPQTPTRRQSNQRLPNINSSTKGPIQSGSTTAPVPAAQPASYGGQGTDLLDALFGDQPPQPPAQTSNAFISDLTKDVTHAPLASPQMSQMSSQFGNASPAFVVNQMYSQPQAMPTQAPVYGGGFMNSPVGSVHSPSSAPAFSLAAAPQQIPPRSSQPLSDTLFAGSPPNAFGQMGMGMAQNNYSWINPQTLPQIMTNTQMMQQIMANPQMMQQFTLSLQQMNGGGMNMGMGATQQGMNMGMGATQQGMNMNMGMGGASSPPNPFAHIHSFASGNISATPTPHPHHPPVKQPSSGAFFNPFA
eukprot:c11152_g1_i1.p1 GENE.c11152_g1_i1~~c11152_g1_i1.p1  ORF type:complete len:537 (-),score=128.66 c11152_g1_i1:1138-2670(-)